MSGPAQTEIFELMLLRKGAEGAFDFARGIDARINLDSDFVGLCLLHETGDVEPVRDEHIAAVPRFFAVDPHLKDGIDSLQHQVEPFFRCKTGSREGARITPVDELPWTQCIRIMTVIGVTDHTCPLEVPDDVAGNTAGNVAGKTCFRIVVTQTPEAV